MTRPQLAKILLLLAGLGMFAWLLDSQQSHHVAPRVIGSRGGEMPIHPPAPGVKVAPQGAYPNTSPGDDTVMPDPDSGASPDSQTPAHPAAPDAQEEQAKQDLGPTRDPDPAQPQDPATPSNPQVTPYSNLVPQTPKKPPLKTNTPKQQPAAFVPKPDIKPKPRPHAVAKPVPPPATGTIVEVPKRAGGRKLPSSFIGFSLEHWTLNQLAGSSRQTAPPFVQLVKGLSANGPLNIRIGGDSEDRSWWLPNSRGVPRGVMGKRVKSTELAKALPEARGSEYLVQPQWVATLARMARSTGSPLMVGLNLASGAPTQNTMFAQAVKKAMPRGHQLSFEVGNEPALYWRFPARWSMVGGVLTPSKQKRNLSYSGYTRDWAAYQRQLRIGLGKNVPLAGTALGCPGMRWCNLTGRFYRTFRSNLRWATMHIYAIRQPFDAAERKNPLNPLFPSARRLLADEASKNMASRIDDQIKTAHRQGLPLQINEFNTTPFGGAPGLSDSFAASLWSLSALPSMWRAGVDRINMHFGYGTAYRPFWIEWSNGHPHAKVAPLYYGMTMFADAVGSGARLQPSRIIRRQAGVDHWLLRDRQGKARLLMVNRSARSSTLWMHHSGGGVGKLMRLSAGSNPAALSGVRWAGRVYGADGRLHGRKQVSTVRSRGGYYRVDLQPYSAALLIS